MKVELQENPHIFPRFPEHDADHLPRPTDPGKDHQMDATMGEGYTCMPGRKCGGQGGTQRSQGRNNVGGQVRTGQGVTHHRYARKNLVGHLTDHGQGVRDV